MNKPLQAAAIVPDGSPPIHGNPLIAAADTLLLSIAMLAHNARPASITQLQRQLLDLLDDFTDTVEATEPQWLDDSRYALCALIDETLLTTAWGAGDWIPLSLLHKLYNENYSGESFFKRLEQASAQRQSNVPLLEFFHLCLSLGYCGRFQRHRYTDAGIQQLRAQLLAQVAQYGAPTPALSPPLPRLEQNGTSARLPLWIAAVLVTTITLGIHQGLAAYLSAKSEPLLTTIQQLARDSDLR